MLFSRRVLNGNHEEIRRFRKQAAIEQFAFDKNGFGIDKLAMTFFEVVVHDCPVSGPNAFLNYNTADVTGPARN